MVILVRRECGKDRVWLALHRASPGQDLDGGDLDEGARELFGAP